MNPIFSIRIIVMIIFAAALITLLIINPDTKKFDLKSHLDCSSSIDCTRLACPLTIPQAEPKCVDGKCVCRTGG